MTKPQHNFYIHEWSRCWKILRAADPSLAARESERVRHDFHVHVLGHDKSHLDFTNRELDLLLAAFHAISAPDDLNFQLRQQRQAETRLRHSVRARAPEAYRRAILTDRFHVETEDDLGESELVQFRNTLAARANSLRRRAIQNAKPECLATADCPF